MKDTIHYQIGQKIGEFTISAYNKDEGRYELTCSCGNTSTGASDFVTRKISILLSEGYAACQNCTFKFQEKLKTERLNNDVIYTHKDIYREYVRKSKDRNIEFNISIQDASILFTSNCYYCGKPPLNSRTRVNGNTIFYQGIDRVDNTKGYEVDNTVPCCKYCNAAKLDRSQEEFFEHIRTIYFNKVQRSASQEA